MNLKIKLIVILLSLITVKIAVCQRPVINPCSNPDGGERAFFTVRYFLTAPIMADARVQAGVTNETVEQIRPIADANICSMLNQIVSSTPKYANIDGSLEADRTKYYFRTNNFYYIFWNKKPEYDNLPNTGLKKLFIVISADYQSRQDFYF